MIQNKRARRAAERSMAGHFQVSKQLSEEKPKVVYANILGRTIRCEVKAKTRFQRFKLALWSELGESAVLLDDGQVLVLASEFSPQRFFRTLQRAIDEFARYMPDDLK